MALLLDLDFSEAEATAARVLRPVATPPVRSLALPDVQWEELRPTAQRATQKVRIPTRRASTLDPPDSDWKGFAEALTGALARASELERATRRSNAAPLSLDGVADWEEINRLWREITSRRPPSSAARRLDTRTFWPGLVDAWRELAASAHVRPASRLGLPPTEWPKLAALCERALREPKVVGTPVAATINTPVGDWPALRAALGEVVFHLTPSRRPAPVLSADLPSWWEANAAWVRLEQSSERTQRGLATEARGLSIDGLLRWTDMEQALQRLFPPIITTPQPQPGEVIDELADWFDFYVPDPARRALKPVEVDRLAKLHKSPPRRLEWESAIRTARQGAEAWPTRQAKATKTRLRQRGRKSMLLGRWQADMRGFRILAPRQNRRGEEVLDLVTVKRPHLNPKPWPLVRDEFGSVREAQKAFQSQTHLAQVRLDPADPDPAKTREGFEEKGEGKERYQGLELTAGCVQPRWLDNDTHEARMRSAFGRILDQGLDRPESLAGNPDLRAKIYDPNRRRAPRKGKQRRPRVR